MWGFERKAVFREGGSKAGHHLRMPTVRHAQVLKGSLVVGEGWRCCP